MRVGMPLSLYLSSFWHSFVYLFHLCISMHLTLPTPPPQLFPGICKECCLLPCRISLPHLLSLLRFALLVLFNRCVTHQRMQTLRLLALPLGYELMWPLWKATCLCFRKSMFLYLVPRQCLSKRGSSCLCKTRDVFAECPPIALLVVAELSTESSWLDHGSAGGFSSSYLSISHVMPEIFL